MHSAPFTAQDAATEIIALINSRVSSPHHDELLAIVAKVTTAEQAATDLQLPFDALPVEHAIIAFDQIEDDDALDQWDLVFEGLARDAWKMSRHSLSALRATALIAKHWHTPSHKCVDQVTGEEWRGAWRKPEDCDDWSDRAVAELIEAALRFGTLAARPDVS